MPSLFGSSPTFEAVAKISNRFRRFITPETDEQLVARVKEYSNTSLYDASIWGDQNVMTNLALLREVPAMLREGIIESSLAFLMETAFQTNEKGEVMWVTSPHDVIKNELDAFHAAVGFQNKTIQTAFNILLWGNLTFKHYFNKLGQFCNFTPIPDFTKVIPIVVSGRVLGYMVNGEFRYSYEYSYAQLEYFKNLGGLYQNNLISMSGIAQSEPGKEVELLGQDFANEFVVAPSYLSGAVRAWKNINIIEDALLLNRMDQANYFRVFSVLVGGSATSKTAIRTLNYYRNLFQKVRRVSFDSNGMRQTGTGSNFEIILPKTDRQGLDVQEIGSNVEVRALKDLDLQYQKLFAALRVQPSQIGFGEEQANAVGDTQGQSYDRRTARICRTLVFSVQRWWKDLDTLYLRSRGYDVRDGDWSYGTVSLSVMEDQMRGETLKAAISNLKEIGELLGNTLQLESYNKNYLVESLLKGPLSSAGLDVMELLKAPESDRGQQLVSGAEGGSFSYKKFYIGSMLDVMENANIASPRFIASARASLEDLAVRHFISSASVKAQGPLSWHNMDMLGYSYPDSTPLDLTGSVYFMSGKKADITSDFQKLTKPKDVTHMVSFDVGAVPFIPGDLKLTLGDINSATIRSINSAYINQRGELILTEEADLSTYLHMKKSGLMTVIIQNLRPVQV